MAPSNQDMLNGFQINWINIRDIDTGEILWHGNEDYSFSEKRHKKVDMPKKIIKSRAVSREIHFSSVEGWDNLKVVHTIFYKGMVMEEWYFEFGLVHPNSSNNWQSIIEAAPEVKMMAVDILSGNIVISTKFFNNETLITTSKIRLFYV